MCGAVDRIMYPYDPAKPLSTGCQSPGFTSTVVHEGEDYRVTREGHIELLPKFDWGGRDPTIYIQLRNLEGEVKVWRHRVSNSMSKHPQRWYVWSLFGLTMGMVGFLVVSKRHDILKALKSKRLPYVGLTFSKSEDDGESEGLMGSKVEERLEDIQAYLKLAEESGFYNNNH